jgi:phenylalanyl-tRNA synthetase beta chain
MLISWNWLKQYVPLDMPHDELERRVMMAGLNHESTTEVGDDLAIDLEVTSNRPDCLGHIGIAREVAVLFGKPLTVPPAKVTDGKTLASDLVNVRIECPDLCLRYTARVVRGVKIAPSPAWMAKRLEAVGITPINNVVDISNYVLMECGQPLHTFDFGKLKGKGNGKAKEIVVRRPRSGEKIEAIDHKSYDLGPEMCMICDASDPVAIGGVMGGAETEISFATRDVLVEAAEFAPVSIRNTARQLNLHSDSSYRFERRVDPEGLDWASRRCCELILELAGGELAAGIVDVGQAPPRREPIVLRLSQLKRILGIEIEPKRVREILLALGNEEIAPSLSAAFSSLTVVAPSWRRDLTREIDLIEEVARIHGYEAIPEDVGVPMVPSARTRADRVLDRVRRVLASAGFDEAMTLSVVDEKTSSAMSPWTDAEPLRSQTPVIRGADCLRRSLVPSLLNVRQTNQALGNNDVDLFEIARVYLPSDDGLPREELMLGITSGHVGDAGKSVSQMPTVKGILESIVAELKIDKPLEAGNPIDAMGSPVTALDPAASCSLRLGGQYLGYAGRLTPDSAKQFDLRGLATVAEIKLSQLIEWANLIPQYKPQSPYPAVTRDLNLVVDEEIRWADVAATVQGCREPCFEGLQYRDTYRDAERLGKGKKSLLFTISLRSPEGTFTSQQADEVRDRIVAACRTRHHAELRAQ